MALAKTLFLGCVHFDLGFDVDTEFDIVVAMDYGLKRLDDESLVSTEFRATLETEVDDLALHT